MTKFRVEIVERVQTKHIVNATSIEEAKRLAEAAHRRGEFRSQYTERLKIFTSSILNEEDGDA